MTTSPPRKPRRKPLTAEELEQWLEMTKSIVEALVIMTEVMHQAAESVRAKTLAELESELYT